MDIVRDISNNSPFVFAKFGDGEYNAAVQLQGANCDGTPYTPLLGQKIIEAFKFLSKFPNVYIGKWADFNSVAEYWTTLVPHSFSWADYNILICRSAQDFLNRGVQYFRAIRNAPQQKIYVCNASMVSESAHLLHIDTHIVVDSQHWFEHSYDSVLASLLNSVKDPNNVMLLTSAGMGAKPLIAEFWKKYPNSIIIDVGSALDAVCSNRRSRDYHTVFSNSDLQRIREAIIS